MSGSQELVYISLADTYKRSRPGNTREGRSLTPLLQKEVWLAGKIFGSKLGRMDLAALGPYALNSSKIFSLAADLTQSISIL